MAKLIINENEIPVSQFRERVIQKQLIASNIIEGEMPDFSQINNPVESLAMYEHDGTEIELEGTYNWIVSFDIKYEPNRMRYYEIILINRPI